MIFRQICDVQPAVKQKVDVLLHDSLFMSSELLSKILIFCHMIFWHNSDDWPAVQQNVDASWHVYDVQLAVNQNVEVLSHEI
jgi:hypothetical protein